MSKRALCIGINNYPGTHMDLSGCVNDANDWAAELTARGFSVSKLIDSQATKAAMVSGIRALIGGAVILASTVWIAHRESRRRSSARAAAQAPSGAAVASAPKTDEPALAVPVRSAPGA